MKKLMPVASPSEVNRTMWVVGVDVEEGMGVGSLMGWG